MSNDTLVQAGMRSSPSPASPAKRKRQDGDGDGDGGDAGAVGKVVPPAAQLANNLKSTSPDVLRQTLTQIKQATRVDAAEVTIGPNDKRLVFARELTEDRGWMRLLEAWERIHDMGVPSLLSLPVSTISNVVALLSRHFIDHEVCSSLIALVIPTHGAAEGLTSTLWHKLHGYILSTQSAAAGARTDDHLILASLQLLTHMVRFERGRFSRAIVEHLAWNAKSLTKFAGRSKRGGKNKTKTASGSAATTSKATFARPDVRLAFTSFLLAILYPSLTSSSEVTSDTGAPASVKIQLLQTDTALPHLSSILKTLPGDPPSVVQHVLTVLHRSLLLDAKVPRNVLVNLVRNADLLALLLQIGARGPELQEVAQTILRALCTVPGRGICFQDQGWYGRGGAAAVTETSTDDVAVNPSAEPSSSSSPSSPPPSQVFNPLLNSFIQSQPFSPLYTSWHRSLLLEILTAAKELQPSFLNSMRGPFGGGRMEPPPVASGARLGSLLANRLMGQVLDIDLPDFRFDRPPPLAKIVTTLVPNTLPRSNIAKGLKHTDRLVQWSTLGLLVRILVRVKAFQDCARGFAPGEEAWATALQVVTKECSKRLPDVSAVLSVIDKTSASTAATATTSPDLLLLEGTLRAAHLLLQVTSGGNSSAATPSLDVRRLLNVAGLAETRTRTADANADAVADSESAALKPAIQLHALRILRLSHLASASLFTSSASDASIFGQLVRISQSSDVARQVSDEARALLLESLRESALLFEGDGDEPEAWLAALGSGSDTDVVVVYAGNDTLPHVIAFLEDCLSRCSKNSYRYLESARRVGIGGGDNNDEYDDALPVSPLFATLKEQLSIKIEKGLFATESALQAVLEYVSRLTLLLACRRRRSRGAASVLSRFVEDVRAIVKAQQQQQATLDTLASTLKLLAGGHSRKGSPSPTVNAAASDGDGVDTLLLDPFTENVLLGANSASPLRLRPHLALLHLLAAGSKAKDISADSLAFIPESPALCKVTLHITTLLLKDDAAHSTSLASAALRYSLDSRLVSKQDFREYYLADTAFLSSTAVVQGAAQLFDALLEADCAAVRPYVDASRSGLRNANIRKDQVDSTLLLLPFFGNDALVELLGVLTNHLASTKAKDLQQNLWAIEIVRSVIALLGDQTPAAQVLPVLLRQPAAFASSANLRDLVILTASDLLASSTDMVISDIDVSPDTLAWLATPGVKGADELQAALITKVPAVRKTFLATVEATPTQKMALLVSGFPHAIRALLESANSTRLHDVLARALAWNSFVDEDDVSLTCSTALQALLNVASDKDEEVFRILLEHVPQKPGSAFRLGAYTLAAHLAAARQASSTTAPAQALAAYLQRLIDQGLLWLVRRFAEDESDDEGLLKVIDVFAALIHHGAIAGLATPKAHLASPVLEAGLKRRFTERRQMEFLQVLVRHADVGEASSSALFTTVLAHANFKTATAVASADALAAVEPVGRQIVVSILHSLASRYPSRLLTAQNCRSLIEVYGATLSWSDRLLFDLFKRFEGVTQTTFASLAKGWVGSGSPATSAPTSLDALLSLDAAKAFASCSAFPRERGYEHLEAGLTLPDVGDENDDSERNAQQRAMYDPLWVLLLLSAALQEADGESDDDGITGLQWLSIVRTNALGVTVCALSSRIETVREMATAILSRVYSRLQACDLQEKDHLLMTLDAIKNSSVTGPPLTLLSTLFIAHQLRLITSPSSALYPIFSRFLLQRAVFDVTDVPMLYSMLQSSDPDHWKLQRIWMLRFLRDCLCAGGSTSEWKVMKRRYVWELLCSLHNGLGHAIAAATLVGHTSGEPSSSTTGLAAEASANVASLKQSVTLIEEIMLIAVSRPAIATELITHKGLLTWISQLSSVDGDDDADEDGRHTTTAHSVRLRLLRNAVVAMSSTNVLQKMDPGTSSTWCLAILDALASSSSSTTTTRVGHAQANHRRALDILDVVSSHFARLKTAAAAAAAANSGEDSNVAATSSHISADCSSAADQIQRLVGNIVDGLSATRRAQEAETMPTAATDTDDDAMTQESDASHLRNLGETGARVVKHLTTFGGDALQCASWARFFSLL